MREVLQQLSPFSIVWLPHFSGLTPINQNPRSSTPHPHPGAPIDLACWCCCLHFGSEGSAPSRPCLDLDPLICPSMIALLAPLWHSQHGWRLVHFLRSSLHSEALSWESVASECLGPFLLSHELQPHRLQERIGNHFKFLAVEQNAPSRRIARMLDLGADSRKWGKGDAKVFMTECDASSTVRG
jgi:hypothetical protein